MECGQDELVLESGRISLGVSIEFFVPLSSQPIVVGESGVSFTLPEDSSDLEKIGENKVSHREKKNPFIS